MRKLVALALAGALVFGLAGGAAAEGFKVIVNQANPVRGLPRLNVGVMFMGMTSKWENGEDVAPVDQRPGSAVRAAFSREVHRRSVDDIEAAWQRAVFSGRGTPPPELGSDAEVVEYVVRHPGGIGYVSEGAATDGVKVLEVTR